MSSPFRLIFSLVSMAVLALALATQPAAASQPALGITVRNVRVSHDSFAAHSEPSLAENPRNRNNLIAGSKMFSDPGLYQFKIGTYYSLDGGRTWHDSGLLPGFAGYSTVSDVSIGFSSTGVAYVCVLALKGKKSGVFVSRSTNGGQTFSNPVPVFLDSSGATFSDKPWITVDRTTGPTAGTIYVAWNLDAGGAKSGDPDQSRRAALPLRRDQARVAPETGLVISRSTDGGQTFSAPQVISPFDPEFVIGAVPQVGPGGHVYVVFAAIDNKTGVTNRLEMVTSADGGQTFSAPQVIQDNVPGLPNHLTNSTFRNITMPAFVVSRKDGSLVVAWSDMRYGDADILASSSTDGGATWSAPARVNDDPRGDGKDQFQPALAVAPNGTYTCAWFDRRFDPNNHLIDEVVAQSADDGTTWGQNIRVTKHSWNPAIDAPEPEGKPTNTFIGDYQALAVDNHTVHPLWNDTQNGKSQQIRTAVVAVRVFARR